MTDDTPRGDGPDETRIRRAAYERSGEGRNQRTDTPATPPTDEPQPNHEPTRAAQGTLTRLIGQRAVRYFLSATLILTFGLIFVTIEAIVGSLLCLPDTLSQATSMAVQGGGSSTSVTAALKGHFLTCMVSTALNPFVVLISFLLASLASLPVLKVLQAVDRGELLRSVI